MKPSSDLSGTNHTSFHHHAEKWWDQKGPMALLHLINPVRMIWLKKTLASFYHCEMPSLAPLRILDIGCGGGILCESMARLGATVTGIDVSPSLVLTAKDHAKKTTLPIQYHHTSAEDFAKQSPQQFDVITCFEVLEHVDEPEKLIRACSQLLKKNGIALFSTPNRSLTSKFVMIHMAENILQILPKGTHSWQHFIKPHELQKMLARSHLQPFSICGLHYDLAQQQFRLRKSQLGINYFLSAVFDEPNSPASSQ